jgi:hypothetical protein
VRRFGRRKPLHERLAEAGGLDLAAAPPSGAAPPGWFGEQRGDAGIHGVARPRRWDAVETIEARGLRGSEVHFVVLPDRVLLVEEDETEEALTVLAEGVERAIDVPYRAEGVRREGDLWSVAARRIRVVEVTGLHGDEAELTNVGGIRELVVDGTRTLHPAPALAQAGEAEGLEYVVRARRLDGDRWEVEATPL